MNQIQLICSRFDPTGQFYASAIPALDLNKIQVHAISNGKVESEINLDKGVSVNSLTWAIYNSFNNTTKQQKKKRKRSSMGTQGNGKILEDLVVAIGTNKGSILFYSPSQGTIVHKISDAHSVPVTSIEFTGVSNLWSCDYSGVISNHDLSNDKQKARFESSEKEVRLLYPLEDRGSKDGDLLLASTNIQLVDSSSKKALKSFPGFVHPVAKIIPSITQKDLFLASSKSERNVNINSIEKGNSIKILTAQSDIQDMILCEDETALALVTDEGMVEIFLNPLQKSASPSKRRGAQTVKSDIQISVTRPKTSQPVRIDNLVFAKDNVILTWLENASVPVFEIVSWKDQQTGKPLSGLIELSRAHKTLSKAGEAGDTKVNGADPAAAAVYNESTSVVSSGKDVKNLESDDEDEEESTLAERLDALEVDHEDEEARAQKNDKLQSASGSNGKVEFSTPGTFTTILNQALKTNDHSLLESCLVHRDEKIIKASIQRLDSSLAVRLLERVAEKISRSPAQAGQLNIWIKWVMIAHGGYLVTLPNLLKTLSSLHSTLSDRVSTLPRLLALQGRLEMLNSQMELRRDILESSNKSLNNADDEDDDEDEGAVEYVEDGAYIANGEEDMDSDDDEVDYDHDEDSDNNNGFIELEAEEESQEEDDEGEGFSDMEVDEQSDGEIDDDEDDDEIEVEAKPQSKPKRKVNGTVKGRR